MSQRKIILTVLVLLLVAVVAIGLLAAFGLGDMGKKSVPEKTILEVNFETSVIEYVPADPIAQVMLEDTPRTLGLVEALTRAASDDRVVGLVARVGASGMGFAQIQELRDAVIAFRAGGKTAIAYAETFGEGSPGLGSYYLATAFDEVYLQPSGDVSLTGMMLESPFLSGAFAKLGVTPRMDHRHEYKNAMNTFTETEYTAAHEEAMDAIMRSIFSQMVRGIAGERELAEEQVEALIARGPFYGQEALDEGLVDGLAYRDEVYTKLREQLGEDTELLYLGAYRGRAEGPWDEGETIALVYGAGTVVRGGSEYDPMSGAITMGSDSVAANFRAAIDDEDVKAILFRVDSPGGSYVASDTIWRETLRAKEAGKPVIISMGNVAGSGGYFVAMSADKIVAQPGTITGSIGVLSGKMLTSEMWDKLGITWDDVRTSDNATLWTGTHDYDEAQWARFQTALDRIYEDFTSKVAEGRGMPIERIQELAKGRIWTGEDALERGLVDALGGFDVALGLAREAGGIDADADVELRLFPRPKTPFELFFDEGASSSESRATALAMARVLERVRPLARLAQRAGLLGPQSQVLSMPPEMVVQP